MSKNEKEEQHVIAGLEDETLPLPNPLKLISTTSLASLDLAGAIPPHLQRQMDHRPPGAFAVGPPGTMQSRGGANMGPPSSDEEDEDASRSTTNSLFRVPVASLVVESNRRDNNSLTPPQGPPTLSSRGIEVAQELYSAEFIRPPDTNTGTNVVDPSETQKNPSDSLVKPPPPSEPTEDTTLKQVCCGDVRGAGGPYCSRVLYTLVSILVLILLVVLIVLVVDRILTDPPAKKMPPKAPTVPTVTTAAPAMAPTATTAINTTESSTAVLFNTTRLRH